MWGEMVMFNGPDDPFMPMAGQGLTLVHPTELRVACVEVANSLRNLDERVERMKLLGKRIALHNARVEALHGPLPPVHGKPR